MSELCVASSVYFGYVVVGSVNAVDPPRSKSLFVVLRRRRHLILSAPCPAMDVISGYQGDYVEFWVVPLSHLFPVIFNTYKIGP